MSDFLLNFHFLRPWFLCFLLFPLFLFLKKIKTSEEESSWFNVCDKNLLDFLLIKTGSAKQFSLKAFIYIGMVFASLAAAGPCWKKTEIPTFVVENPTMFVLSMAQDMMLTDVSPSRLERAKFALTDLIDGIHNGQFGLEVYSNEPYIITPISNDARLLKNLMPQIVSDIVPDHGDRLDRAIDLAVKRFKSSGYLQGNIILFASDVGQYFNSALENAANAAAQNYKIYVIDTSYSGSEKLRLLAQKGNGMYFNVQNTQLQPLIDNINQTNQEHIKQSQNIRSKFLDYGYYLLIIPLFCTLAFFRRGLLILFLCCISLKAHAGLFLNDNQEGLRLFNKGAYEEAFQHFQDANWKGISLYKQNKLEESLKEFQKENNALAFYNQGVVLVKLCKYKEALEAFKMSLEKNPLQTDAEYNINVLNNLFERAKENPSLLQCGENQQQNQNPQNNQDKQQTQQDNQPSEKKQSKQNESEQDKQQKQEQQEQQQNESEQEKQNNSKPNDTQSEQQQNKQDQQKQSESEKQQQQTDKGQNKDNQPKEQNDTGQNKQDSNKQTQENGEESANENNSADSDKREQEQTVNLLNVKKGSDKDKYDDEALILQQRYRKIPENPGGLLREFIKKEYVKDRYGDENIH